MNTNVPVKTYSRCAPPAQENLCFEDLYTNYLGKVYQRCLSITRSHLQAEDFTQDIFIKVLTNLNSFQGRSSVYTWLLAITTNYCRDQLRLAKRNPLITIDEGVDLLVIESFDNQVQEDRFHLLNKAMATLTLAEQTMIRLKYIDGVSIQEIAHQFKINNSAVKMRLKRCREKLHRYVQSRNTACLYH